jgi:hypothetical protein
MLPILFIFPVGATNQNTSRLYWFDGHSNISWGVIFTKFLIVECTPPDCHLLWYAYGSQQQYFRRCVWEIIYDIIRYNVLPLSDTLSLLFDKRNKTLEHQFYSKILPYEITILWDLPTCKDLVLILRFVLYSETCLKCTRERIWSFKSASIKLVMRYGLHSVLIIAIRLSSPTSYLHQTAAYRAKNLYKIDFNYFKCSCRFLKKNFHLYSPGNTKWLVFYKCCLLACISCNLTVVRI